MNGTLGLCLIAFATILPVAHAASVGDPPTIVDGYPVIGNPEFDSSPNTMMYTVTVRVSDTFRSFGSEDSP